MRVHHIAISVRDAEQSKKFYQEHFGFVETNSFTKPGWDGSAKILELDTIRLEIFQFDSKVEKKDDLNDLKVLGLKHIGFEVESVAEKHRELKEKGVDIDEPKKGTTCAWFCFLRDPDGIPLELFEPR